MQIRHFITAWLLAVLAVAGCGGDPAAPERPAGSALWVEPDDLAAVSSADLEHLRQGEVRELAVPLAGLAWRDGRPAVAPRPLPSPATAGRRLPLLAVVRGVWNPGSAEAPPEMVEELAAALRRPLLAAESAGFAPAGLLLDLVPPRGTEALEGYGAALAALRRGLAGRWYLAVSLDRAALHEPGAETVAAAADLLVPFLYGPRPDGGPGPRGGAGWDLAELDRDVARLEALGRPYLLGVGSVGVLSRGEDATHQADLATLVRSPGLGTPTSELLASPDSQLYRFPVVRPLRLGEWSLARGDELVARRLTAAHVRALGERMERLGAERHRGQLYVRHPREGEGLALRPADLAAAGAATPPRPRIALELVPRGRGAFAVRLTHAGGPATDLASFGHNEVEVAVEGGRLGSVDPGEFPRWELQLAGRRVGTNQALRQADGLRLNVPMLQAGDVVESGRIEVRGGTATVTARFLLPGGDEIELPAARWPPD